MDEKEQAPDIPDSKHTGPGPMLAFPQTAAGHVPFVGGGSGVWQFGTSTASGGHTEKFADEPVTTCQWTVTSEHCGNDSPTPRVELFSRYGPSVPLMATPGELPHSASPAVIDVTAIPEIKPTKTNRHVNAVRRT